MCVRCNIPACGGCGNQNPQGYYNVVANVLKNYELQNPLPEEVSDDDKTQKFFKDYKLVPYAGNELRSSHRILNYIYLLSSLSSTLSSCIQAIGFYGFGGKMDVIKSDNSEFDLSNVQDVLSNIGNPTTNGLEEKQRFIASISEIKKEHTWNELSSALYTSYKRTGNAYLEVVIYRVLNESKVEFRYIDPKNALYRLGDIKSVLISKRWDLDYLMKNNAREVKVFPNYSESKNEIRTVIHIKNGTADYYGRPDWWGCNYDAFLEIKNKEYLLKSVHNSFTGIVAMEFESDPDNGILDEADAKDNGWQNAAERFAHNYTNRGEKPSSILVMERPTGSKPFAVHEFKPNTNEKYFKAISQMCENEIVKVNNWSKKLLGIDSSTGLSNDAFISELKSKTPIIEYYQNIIDNSMINTAFDFVGGILGNADLVNLNIKHKSALDPLIKEKVKEEAINKQISDSGNINQ